MDDIQFPGKLSFLDSNNDFRQRYVAARQPGCASVPEIDDSPSRQDRNSVTNDALLEFSQVAGTPDTELTELDHGDGQHTELAVEVSPPTPSTETTTNPIRHAYETFIEGNLESTRIPDPEAPPSPAIEPDQPREPGVGSLPWIKEKTRRRPTFAMTKKLVDDVMERFPPRAKLKVQVVDFYAHRTTRKFVSLGEITTVMDPSDRPANVHVRWIHAPLGIGLYHSSVEDIFLKGLGGRVGGHWRRPSVHPRGKRFVKAGRAGWPYLETEILNVRSMKEMQDTRNIAQAFLKNETAQKVLNKRVTDGDYTREVYEDVRWRSYHIGKGKDPSYWETVKSDLPLLLSDGALIMKSPAATKQEPSWTMKRQTLQDEEEYRFAYLARDPFRCFNRGDSTLLTLSPAKGIDYLNRHLPTITKDPKDDVNCWRNPELRKEESVDNSEPGNERADDSEFPSKDLSVVGYIFQEFEFSGTSRWQYKTVEWLIVFLMTEISCTPHSMRSGYSIAAILDVYDTHINKLIERKFEPWSDDTAKLFRSYLTAIDELRTLDKIYKKKLQFLEHLGEDCVDIQEELTQDGENAATGPITITMAERVEFALRAVRDLSNQCEELYTDLSSSLESMSQLRQIEQDDRAVSADSQGKGILILSAVTVFFLPLSFLASVFSMNVKGISDDPPAMTLARFLKMCGGIVGVLALLVSIFLWRVNTGNNMRTFRSLLRKPI